MASANHFNHWVPHMTPDNFIQMTNFIDATVQGQKLKKFLCLCGAGGTGKTKLLNEIINYVNGTGAVGVKVWEKPNEQKLKTNLIALDGYENNYKFNGMIKEILGSDPMWVNKKVVTASCNVVIVTLEHCTEAGMNARAIYIDLF